MYKLDFSDLHENGYRINQLRLMYSYKFRGANFKKNADHFSSNDDLAGERDLFTQYFIENMEINYTFYLAFKGISFFMLLPMIISLLIFDYHFVIPAVFILLSAIFWFLAKRRKDDFGLARVALGFSESIFNNKINEKYNMGFKHGK